VYLPEIDFKLIWISIPGGGDLIMFTYISIPNLTKRGL